MNRGSAEVTFSFRILAVMAHVLVWISWLGGASVAGASDFNHSLASRIHAKLPVLERRLAEIEAEMKRLPVLTDMDALGSHGFHSDFTSDSESNWFRIDWKSPMEIDGIAIIPTRLTTQSGDMSNYGFPNSLIVEAGLPGRDQPVVIAELKNSHLDFRRGEPVFFSIPPTKVLWLRFVPVDLPRFPGKMVRFFSVAELMVFRGDVNIAPRGDLSARFSIDAEVGWNIRYLVDGQSPLGPPEMPPPSASLGWHTDIAASSDAVTWAMVDLGGERLIDGVRIVAAKGDSPVKGPGFGFPVGFRIETSPTVDGDDWQTVWTSGEDPYPNPGYNPVRLGFDPVMARRVRLLIHKQHQPDLLTAPRVLLSEFEVLEGSVNHALGRPVATSDVMASRPHDAKRVWSSEGLTDGHSSTGRLIPLRRWVEDLSKRFDLALEQRGLAAERERILASTHLWTLVTVFTLLMATVITLVIWMARLRLAGRRQIRELRRTISSDLHDEVGSNLATISLLADLTPAGADHGQLADISRLARESSLSLREIIDLTLIPNRARKPLPDRLREIAGVMLKDHAWDLVGDASPNLDPEQRRNLIFFFKEALHNISRHARATTVSIRFEIDELRAVLTVSDNGQGLPPPPPAGQPRLRTLEQRAESLHGSLAVDSAPDRGTTLTMRFPLKNSNRK